MRPSHDAAQWFSTGVCTLVRSHTAVRSAWKPSLGPTLSRNTGAAIQVRNHSHVISVDVTSPGAAPCSSTNGLTPERSHSNVIYVRNISLGGAHCISTNGHTQEKNPLSVRSAVNDSLDGTHCRSTPKTTCDAPYKCSVCGQQFARPYALQKHQRCHSGEKQYTCDVCGENFSRRSNLHVHQRTHTGEKPFKCTICGNLFSRRSNLQVHVRSHSGIKPYKCDICSKQFVRSSTLVKHMQAHLSTDNSLFEEERPVTKVDMTSSINTNPSKFVSNICSSSTYGVNKDKNNSNLFDCGTNMPSSEPTKPKRNDDNYKNNPSINSTHHCKPTDPRLPMEQSSLYLCTHCGKPSSKCNHLQTLPVSLPQPEMLDSQQLSSYTPVPSKNRLSTSLTPRKWLEPPTVIVATSENPNDKLDPATCLHTTRSPWQRNIPSSLVTTPLCSTLVIMQPPSVMETWIFFLFLSGCQETHSLIYILSNHMLLIWIFMNFSLFFFSFF